MSEQHRATPEQWALTESRGLINVYATSSCLLELRDLVESFRGSVLHLAAVTSNLGHRVEALEATQPLRTFTADEVAPIVVPTADPAAGARQLTLVERVARRLARFASEGWPGDDATPIASAVLCDVADWLAEGSGRSGSWNTPAADLRHEASR